MLIDESTQLIEEKQKLWFLRKEILAPNCINILLTFSPLDFKLQHELLPKFPIFILFYRLNSCESSQSHKPSPSNLSNR